MPNPTCSIQGCGNKQYVSGLCVSHRRQSVESGESGKRIPCRWEPCEKFASVAEYCRNHYAKAKRRPDTDLPWIDPVDACKWPACTAVVFSRGYCQRDYQRAWKLGNFHNPWVEYAEIHAKRLAPKVCKWPGCHRVTYDAGFCARDASRARSMNNMIDPWNYWVTHGRCEVCGNTWGPGRNRNRRVCSMLCNVQRWKNANPEKARQAKMDAVRRRRARMAKVHVEMFSINDVRKAKGDDCYICKGSIDYTLKFPEPGSPSIDHVMPLSLGGHHTIENVAMTHLTCNLRKGTSPATEFV